ncbi:hypothetical protein PSHT_00768 [Puccinia striiformis]|uniref:F-box domain-containing protein n=1 Tax=Puccinia striiformis TaxID=27350 RepID=A0A2S4WM56_9BASI|nr:hypothetical protein PSHT_00768 [Puccinia striiformis]
MTALIGQSQLTTFFKKPTNHKKMSTLLQDAVLRAANHSSTTRDQNDDAVLTRVHSPLTSSPPSESTNPSRPNTPTKSPTASRSRVGVRQKREAALKAKLDSKDPLRRLPIDVSVRIFTLVGLGADGCGGHLDGNTFSAVKDLLNCALVCQKWRSSSVINYVWYKLAHQTTYHTSIKDEFQAPTWTRKDSRTNWSQQYKQINQSTPNQDSAVIEEEEEGPSQKELREAQWEAQEDEKISKSDARAFYKDLNGRKLKNKSAKSLAGIDRTGSYHQEILD